MKPFLKYIAGAVLSAAISWLMAYICIGDWADTQLAQHPVQFAVALLISALFGATVALLAYTAYLEKRGRRKPGYFERKRIEKERERKRAEREAANERKAMERLCSEIRTMQTLDKRELAKILADGSVIYKWFVHDCPIEDLALGGWVLEENLPDCSIRYTPSSKAVKVNNEHPELLEAFIAEYREATK